MQTKMVVAGLTTEPVNNTPIVILQDDISGRRLPLFIGVIEATAIASELEKVPPRRPLTHDLLRSTVEVLGGAVQQVRIVDWRDNTFFCLVVLMQGARTVEVDARPSDAIALALRVGAPIYCESSVLDRVDARRTRYETALPGNVPPPVAVDGPMGVPPRRGRKRPLPLIKHAGTSMVDLLENLPPETFGKYKM